ncbi:hypothetical protein [Actinomadura madurae]|uniref:hypothetical protein n=1 Tax=Actinomadura madurae TaxID=1993 RepID=UPI0020D20AD7|nr:hypothetical protein [Actinomadura madurae]MCQ0013540.1 hypothetical protein [Actinomadura madurae]
MLDVPDGDTRRLIDWGNRIIANTDPDYADVLLHSEESERYRDLPFRSPAALEVFEYGRELAARPARRHRHRPGQQAGQPGPGRRRAAVGPRLRQLLPAARGGPATRRRGTRSPTRCGRSSRTRPRPSGCARTST